MSALSHALPSENSQATPPANATRQRLAIFIYKNRDGGVEKMLANLALGSQQLGVNVDMIVSDRQGPFIRTLPPSVRIIEIGAGSVKYSIQQLAAYLRQEKPDVLLTGKPSDDKIILQARKTAHSTARCFVGTGTAVSRQINERHFNPLRKKIKLLRKKYTYRAADGIIATSRWVAKDIATIADLPLDRISVIGNPLYTPEMAVLGQQAVNHPAFLSGQFPIIVSAGRLSHEKDFATLLHAFKLVCENRPARLFILGDGPDKTQLVNLTQNLDIEQAVFFPGFVENPLAYFAKANVFVLSSLWEGFGNVLVEALAVGTSIVATDCPGGPRDILQQGRYGKLVPVGDSKRMAQAILDTLDEPLPRDQLIEAARAYSIDNISQRYLEILGLTVSHPCN